MIRLDGLVTVLIFFGALIVAVIWGCWELVDAFFIDHTVRVSEPLVPHIEIIVRDGVADTTYIYNMPK